MKNDKNKKSFSEQKLASVICSIVFLASVILIKIMNYNDISLDIGNFHIESGGLSGIATQLLVLIAIWIEINIKNSHKLCMTLMTLMLVFMMTPVVISGNVSSFPGIAMVIGGIAILHVINQYIKKISKDQKILNDIANTDYLTGLPNRRHLMKNLKELENGSDKFALIFIDIDNFKKINDTLGHDFGDNVLCKICELWNEVQGKEDYIARLGGDEFALIIKNYTNYEQLENHVARFKNQINKKIAINNQPVFISASFGVVCSEQCRKHKLMLKYADIAMYNAKSTTEKISFFKDDMKSEIERLVTTESMIRYALEHDGFYLMYQPQFDTETKKLRGFETLIRMKDKNGNTVRPDEFIAVSEQNNLIIEIDKWVLKTALSTFKTFIDKNYTNFLL